MQRKDDFHGQPEKTPQFVNSRSGVQFASVLSACGFRMRAMSLPNYPSESPLPWAITVSVLLHALILMLPQRDIPSDQAAPRLQARLAHPAEKQVNATKPVQQLHFFLPSAAWVSAILLYCF